MVARIILTFLSVCVSSDISNPLFRCSTMTRSVAPVLVVSLTGNAVDRANMVLAWYARLVVGQPGSSLR